MGEDSVTPFLTFPNKWVILLALTSNGGSKDFQTLSVGDKALFEEVLTKSQEWGTDEQLMYVVGATKADMLAQVRALAPEHFLLVPGVGAQGGSLEEVSKYGMNSTCGLLVNSSRAIIYASSGEDFAEKAAEEAQKVQAEMAQYLDLYLKK
jgi:orotidine-5'-phosphate decarboxylase